MKNLLLSYKFDVSFMAIEKRIHLINRIIKTANKIATNQ
ncbi:hypothetical protein B425_2252 [Bacillus amyloliquefaciens]|nr:hypothetical protein B425_2252 [Bacillus amyloliquefaciens]